MSCCVPPADSIKAAETQLLISNEDTAGDALLLCKVAVNCKYAQLVQNMPEEFAMAKARMKWEITNGNRLIIPDPYETYLYNLPAGQSLDALTVTKGPSLLCSILPLVNNHLHVECIINPGCQVITMSRDVCHTLSLPYDSDITLNMQSANGKINKLLGLARNVPFCFGNVTIYLQVHIIHSPMYNILLRKPFDVLTQSMVCNFMNEDQTITIHNLNTGLNATVLTFMRGTQCYLCPSCCEEEQ